VARRLLVPSDLPDRVVTGPRLTDEQRRAVDRRDGSLLVSAGAGAGKTSVLAERFARAVLDDGVPVDAILAITFTEKAAGELAGRVRRRFLELGAVEQARAAETAWISTIHGFCSRVLRAHALAAGIDPEYEVLEEIDAERIALDAFDRALEELLAGDDESVRLAVVAAYTPDRLAEMVRTTHGRLRSRGQARPALPDRDPPLTSADPAALRAAADAALAELAGAEGVTVERARGAIDRCLRLLDGDGLAAADTKQLERLAAKPGNAKALQGPAYAAYVELVGDLCAEAAAVREYEMHLLLDQLLRSYGAHYERLKAERSALDFDDLELRTQALLEADPAVREEYAGRFRHVMVDEFQDTNPLQDEILALIAADNVFRVGDDRQSIYRFRHADVGLFRRYREQARAAGREERITVNFRSRGEILDAVNHVFAELWGDDFEPLRERPGVRDEPPRAGPCVELLVADRDGARGGRWKERASLAAGGGDPGDVAEALFGPTMRGVAAWRAAEARLLARRIDELAGPGRPFAHRDVAVLLRATTSASVYERALEERGVPTHVLGGRGYWSQQQVGDLRAYLAALANPADELAVYSALASPLAGVSLDALVLVARQARRAARGAWETIADLADGAAPTAELAAKLPADDLSGLAGFARHLRDDRAVATRVSLETLIDRAVTRSGYDRAVLALPAGDRRLANVRKLMRMAREFEAREGRDLRRFIDFVAERDLIQEREGHAPLEAEQLDAVRIMTIHRAKGLEFPVVCVADLGKAGREDDAALRIGEAGEVGIRLASLDGGSFDGAEMERLRERDRLEAEAEERRIFYVAATRAREHLVLSGATDLEQLPPAEDLTEPMRWFRAALAPDLPDLGARGEATAMHGDRQLTVRCEALSAATLDELLPAGEHDPSAPEPEPAALDALDAPALSAVTVPPAQPVSRISYSQLHRYAECGYRFYLERVLRLPRADDGPAADAAAPAGEPALAPTVRGSVVHALLEELDFARPAAPEPARVAELIAAFGDEARPAEVTEIVDLVDGFTRSALCDRLGAAGALRTELEFAFDLDTGRGRGVLVTGVVDVHAAEAGGTLVVDYKTDRLGERTPAEAVDESYATQRTVYALAALRGGAESAEVVYAFLERPEQTVSAVYTPADVPRLEERLRDLSTGIVEGRFAPSERPWKGLCGDCPGRRALCAWSPERTLAELPAAQAPS
jgi:ATP-dependent exoDNAse (exonuclease V) beta subunit